MAARPLLAAAVALLVSVPALGQAPTPLLPTGPEAPSAPPPGGAPSGGPPQTIPAPQPLGPATAPPSAPAPAGPAAPAAPTSPAPAPPPAPVQPPAPAPPAASQAPPEQRVFCNQPVNFTLAPRDSVPQRFRDFVGIYSDAAWTPHLCAALIVENVSPDGIATIVYVFGSMGTSPAGGGVLNGTGIVRRGELRFQNTDGSQYSFQPFYSDLDGHLVTPQGQTYETIFKRNF